MGIRRRTHDDAVEALEFVADRNPDLACSVPSLVEFLARGAWDDGVTRLLGTVLVCCQDGVWKGWVNDKDNGRQAWVSAVTLSDLLSLVDSGLETDELPWRRAPVQPAKGKGRS